MSEKNTTWEMKDRYYYLSQGKSPLTYTLSSKHTSRFPLMFFDEEKGYNRELRYASNQKSVFVDEQQGPVTLKHIMFKDGVLHVNKQNQSLQKMLSLYHPHKDIRYHERDNEVVAEVDLDETEIEITALNTAWTMEVEQAEAILRVEMGSNVNKLSSKEIKRDLMVFARRNPKLLLSLANDENVQLRNFGIKATELGIVKLSQDNRTFKWGSNGRKLMTIPFDENPYSALAAWFQTDEGLEVYKSIQKRMD